MKRSIGRIALLLLALAMMVTLSGCTIFFTITGSDSYVIWPNGDILNGSLEECQIEMDVSTKGSILKDPKYLNIELEGLLMSMEMNPVQIDAALEDIGAYLETALSFDDHTVDTVGDTFTITGRYELIDFWSDMGISGLAVAAEEQVLLSAIIGTTAYDQLIDSIVDATNDLTANGSSIDFEMAGALESSDAKVVGDFILWFDSINPAIIIP